MKMKAKRGFEFDVEVSGFSNDPVISVAPFRARGKSIPATTAVVQHWTQKGLEKGLVLGKTRCTPQIYIECDESIAQVEEAITSLPEKKKYIHLEKRMVYSNSFGYDIEVENWFHDGLSIFDTGQGYTVNQAQMESFLEKKGIGRIEREQAIDLFVSEHDIEVLKSRRAEASAKVRAAFDDDVAEVGIEEASRNWE